MKKQISASDAVLARIRKNSSLLMVDVAGRGIAFAEYLRDQGIKAKHVRVVNNHFNAQGSQLPFGFSSDYDHLVVFSEG